MPGSALTRWFHSVLERAEALEHRLGLLLPALHRAVAGLVHDHVRPVGQLAALLEREVEQRGQRHRRQLLRHQVDPVELLADRQGIEDLAGALAHHRRHLGDVGRRHGRADRLALRTLCSRLVHGDEAGAAAAARLAAASALQRRSPALAICLEVGQADALGGGERLMVGVHRHDVVPSVVIDQ